MAKRIENECAFCAEEIVEGDEIIGKDWKVYCGKQCAVAGEKMSLEEWRKVMLIELVTADAATTGRK
jgi:hypothetical protein